VYFASSAMSSSGPLGHRPSYLSLNSLGLHAHRHRVPSPASRPRLFMGASTHALVPLISQRRLTPACSGLATLAADARR